jgi:hypothetical protein
MIQQSARFFAIISVDTRMRTMQSSSAFLKSVWTSSRRVKGWDKGRLSKLLKVYDTTPIGRAKLLCDLKEAARRRFCMSKLRPKMLNQTTRTAWRAEGFF